MPPATDAQTVDSLYRDHHAWLVALFRRKINCPDDAADLAQDTFLRVVTSRDIGNETTFIRKPRSYLATIANRVWVDVIRRRTIERAYLETLASQPQAYDVSSEMREIIIETLIEIDVLLDSMAERTRQIFLMAQIDGLSYVEISRRMKLSVNSVRKHFIRAITDCLQLIED